MENVSAVSFTQGTEKRRGPSVIGSTITQAAIGAGAGALFGKLRKVDGDAFVKEGTEALKKQDVTKTAEELQTLFEEGTKNKELKGFKDVVSSIKKSRMKKEAIIGAALCGTLGLIFGIAAKVKANKAAKAEAVAE